MFTNLGRDHLDFHATMERYFAAKARLFTPAMAALGVVNADDAYGRRLLDDAGHPDDELLDRRRSTTSTVGPLASTFRWRGHAGAPAARRAVQRLERAGGRRRRRWRLGVTSGRRSPPAWPKRRPVPGRFEPVDAGQPFAVIVDFAHTPESLASVLARRLARWPADGRVIVVFGCGGDRDPAKRPLMGDVAARPPTWWS